MVSKTNCRGETQVRKRPLHSQQRYLRQLEAEDIEGAVVDIVITRLENLCSLAVQCEIPEEEVKGIMYRSSVGDILLMKTIISRLTT